MLYFLKADTLGNKMLVVQIYEMQNFSKKEEGKKIY